MCKPKSIGLYLKLINHIMISNLDTCLKKYDLTFSQMELLNFLRIHGGVMPQKAIENELCVRHTSVVGILQRMNKKGLVSVSVDPDDRRCRIVTLTSKTDDFFEAAENSRIEIESKLTDALTPEERSDLLVLLEKLYRNLSKGKEDVND